MREQGIFQGQRWGAGMIAAWRVERNHIGGGIAGVVRGRWAEIEQERPRTLPQGQGVSATGLEEGDAGFSKDHRLLQRSSLEARPSWMMGMHAPPLDPALSVGQ